MKESEKNYDANLDMFEFVSALAVTPWRCFKFAHEVCVFYFKLSVSTD